MTSLVWAVALLVFLAGLSMVVLRRELLAMLLGLEAMISAANLSLVYHAGVFSDPEGLCAALLILAVAAAEAVLGLALILKVHQSGRPVDSEFLQELKG